MQHFGFDAPNFDLDGPPMDPDGKARTPLSHSSLSDTPGNDTS